MRTAICARGVLTICLLVCWTGSLDASDNNAARLREEALAAMENVVPHAPTAGTLTRVTYGNNHAIWGRIFGDQQIAALVAVDIAVHSNDRWPEDATLFLLLWQNGWKFRQLVGKVSSATSAGTELQIETWDWNVKRRLSPETYYVVSRLELYPAGDHLSWLCNPKSHTLLPTGWRKDAIPSLSDSAITFQHADKPGFSPTIYDVFKFTDRPGDLIASFESDSINGPPFGQAFTVRDFRTGKMESWWFWMKGHSDWQYAVSRRGPAIGGSNPPEDAVATFDWGDDESYHEADYFLWRLTGLGPNALWGIWDQDEKPERPLPRSVKVTGLPEAVEKFTWPPMVPGKN